MANQNILSWVSAALVALLLTLAVHPTHAQTSPFARPGMAPASPVAPAGEPGFYDEFMEMVRQKQTQFYRELAQSVQTLKKENTLAAGWGLIVISLLYGIFHAIGPGHGKAVIASYLVASGQALRRGVMLSLLSSLAQGVTAVLLVAVLMVIFGIAGQGLANTAWYLEQASFALIAIAGTWLLWSAFRGGHDHHHHGHHHHHHDHDHVHTEDGECCDHAHMPDPAELESDRLSLRQAGAVIVAIGIRPCGGAILVLVFAALNQMWLAGIGATFAMSMGTAATVSVVAILTVVSKDTALKLGGGSGARLALLMRVLKILGALAMIALGIIFFAASIGQPRTPFI